MSSHCGLASSGSNDLNHSSLTAPPSFQPDFHKYLLRLENLIYEAKFSGWLAGNICVLFLLKAEMIQNWKGLDFDAWSLPWCERKMVEEGAWDKPDVLELCSFRDGVEPNKEGAAREQTIAGGGAFTWTREGLGLSPVCIRLKSTAWAAAECQEPAGQSRDLSKSFESVALSWAKRQVLSPSLWMLRGSSMAMIGRCTDWGAGDAAGASCSLWHKMSACFLEKWCLTRTKM